MGKKLKFTTVILMLVLLCFTAMVACSSVEPTLEIKSDKNPVLYIGETYTLEYESNVGVTVDAPGGDYNAETGEFTATTKGQHTMTITAAADSKSVSENVYFTIKDVGSTTALQELYDASKGLISSDYSNFSSVNTALNAAKELLKTDVKSTQTVIDEAYAALDAAVKALIPSQFTKAEVTAIDDMISFDGTNYRKAAYYDDAQGGAVSKTFAQVVNEVKALNSNSAIKLHSQYKAAFFEIINQLTSVLELKISNAPMGGVHMILTNSPSNLNMTAAVSEGATVKWELKSNLDADYATKSSTINCNIEDLSADKSYELKVTVSKGELSHTKFFSWSYQSVRAVVHSPVAIDKIEINNEEGTVRAKEIMGFDDGSHNKVRFDTLFLYGNFSIEYDIKWNQNFEGAASSVGLMLTQAHDNNTLDGWGLTHFKGNIIQTHGGSGTPRADVRAEFNLSEKAYRYRVTRTIKSTAAFYSIEILDEDGNAIVSNIESVSWTGHKDRVIPGINFENVDATVSNFSYKILNGGAVNLTALADIIEQTDNEECAADYEITSTQVDDFNNARTTAIETYNNKTTATQAEYTSAANNLISAYDVIRNAQLKDVNDVLAEIAAGEQSFTYMGDTFEASELGDIYEDLILEVKALNDEVAGGTITRQSVYISGMDAIIGQYFGDLNLRFINSDITYIMHSDTVTDDFTFKTIVDASVGIEYSWVVKEGDNIIVNTNYTTADREITLKGSAIEVGKTYTLSVTAERNLGGASSSETEECNVSFVQSNTKINYKGSESSGILVENNKIEFTQAFDFNADGNRVLLSDMYIDGEFVLEFDLEWTEYVFGGANCLAFYLHDAATGNHNNYRNIIRMRDSGSDTSSSAIQIIGNKKVFDGTQLSVNTKYTVRLQLIDKKISVAIIDPLTGAKIIEHTGTDQISFPNSIYTFGITPERGKFAVSNMRVTGASVVSKTELRKLVESTAQYNPLDFLWVQDGYPQVAIEAQSVLDNKKATQSEIDTVYAKLALLAEELNDGTILPLSGYENFERPEFIMDVEDLVSITYRGKTYGAEYSNLDEVKAAIDEFIVVIDGEEGDEPIYATHASFVLAVQAELDKLTLA